MNSPASPSTLVHFELGACAFATAAITTARVLSAPERLHVRPCLPLLSFENFVLCILNRQRCVRERSFVLSFVQASVPSCRPSHSLTCELNEVD
jgi:hypothetical protein